MCTSDTRLFSVGISLLRAIFIWDTKQRTVYWLNCKDFPTLSLLRTLCGISLTSFKYQHGSGADVTLLMAACWKYECRLCATMFSSLQSHDVLWRSEIWKENVVSSTWGWSPQPSQVHTNTPDVSSAHGGSNVVQSYFSPSPNFRVIVTAAQTWLTSSLALPWCLSWKPQSTTDSRVILSFSLPQLRETSVLRRSQPFSLLKENPSDTLCKHTELARPFVFLLYTHIYAHTHTHLN